MLNLLILLIVLYVVEGKKPAPKFTQPSQETQATVGGTAKLECHLSATPKPNIEWTKNGRAINESRRVRTEFDGELSSLIISDLRPEDSGEYQCTAKNNIGTASCRTTLIVSEAKNKPEFKDTMKDVEVVEGDKAVFEVRVTAQPDPEVEWYLRKMRIKSEDKYTIEEDTDRKRYSLTIAHCRREDSGHYRCVVKNSAGEVTCSAEMKVSDRINAPTFVQGTDEQLFEVGKERR